MSQDPFELEETGERVSKLSDAVGIMHKKVPEGPLNQYVGPVDAVVETIGLRQEQPQSARINTAGAMNVTDSKAGMFQAEGPTSAAAAPTAAERVKTDSENKEPSSQDEPDIFRP